MRTAGINWGPIFLMLVLPMVLLPVVGFLLPSPRPRLVRAFYWLAFVVMVFWWVSACISMLPWVVRDPLLRPLQFAIPNHEHVGNFLQLRIPDLGVHPLFAGGHLNAEAGLLEPLLHADAILAMTV